MKLRKWLFAVVIPILIAEIILEVNGCGAIGYFSTEVVYVFLKHQKPISLNVVDQDLDSVYYFFNSTLRPYLRQVPIITSNTAQTAYTFYARSDVAFVAVSPDFLLNAQQSEFWLEYYSQPPYDLKPDQPAFLKEFRIELLTHELLHIAQEYLAVDTRQLFNQVEKWYRDESYGRPTQPEGGFPNRIKSNRIKYLLWWNLYGQPGDPRNESDNAWKTMDYCDRYKDVPRGVEEFAYIGAAVLWPTETDARMVRFAELSKDLIESYVGIINPAILALRNR
jgi:hypothetical protein